MENINISISIEFKIFHKGANFKERDDDLIK